MLNPLVKLLRQSMRSGVLPKRALVHTTSLLSDNSKEWIPPSRPLSGDKGDSHLYSQPPKIGDTIIEDIEDEDNEIEEIFLDEEDLDTSNFIDLDDLDLEDLQKRIESGEFGEVQGTGEDEDIDMEELMRDIQTMVEESEKTTDHVENGNKEEEMNTTEVEDKFQKHFEASDFLETNSNDTNAKAPDWLSTRRQKLSQPTAMDMLTPADARKRRRETDIPVIKYTLLSSEEIMQSLANGGGQDIKLIKPEKAMKSYLGCDGLIVCTATSHSHTKVLTDTIVQNLRKRGLAERGVIGAKFGSEGGEDPTMSARARRKRRIGHGHKSDDGWMCVDCRNYIVHVQDELTRRTIDLEGLWSPGSEQRKALMSLEADDEDAIDDYVAENPVPDEYTQSMIPAGDFWGSDGRYRGGFARDNSSKKSGRFTPASKKH